jgi:hypothetical protein
VLGQWKQEFRLYRLLLWQMDVQRLRHALALTCPRACHVAASPEGGRSMKPYRALRPSAHVVAATSRVSYTVCEGHGWTSQTRCFATVSLGKRACRGPAAACTKPSDMAPKCLRARGQIREEEALRTASRFGEGSGCRLSACRKAETDSALRSAYVYAQNCRYGAKKRKKLTRFDQKGTRDGW